MSEWLLGAVLSHWECWMLKTAVTQTDSDEKQRDSAHLKTLQIHINTFFSVFLLHLCLFTSLSLIFPEPLTLIEVSCVQNLTKTHTNKYLCKQKYAHWLIKLTSECFFSTVCTCHLVWKCCARGKLCGERRCCGEIYLQFSGLFTWARDGRGCCLFLICSFFLPTKECFLFV